MGPSPMCIPIRVFHLTLTDEREIPTTNINQH